jgi:hypothetical protein
MNRKLSRRVDFLGGFVINGGARSPNGERHSHTGGRDQEQRTTTDPVDGESTEDGSSIVEDVEDTVDQGLGGSGVDSDTVKNRVQVVGYQTVSGPLGEEGNSDDDQHSSLVTLADKERLEAAAPVGFLFDLQGGLDFFTFVGSQGVHLVTATVVLDDHSASLVLLSLVHEPSRRLGNEQNESDLEAAVSNVEKGKKLKNSPGKHWEDPAKRRGFATTSCC